MTKDIVVGDELPDWVGAKEYYQKYDPKEVIGRWVQQDNMDWNFICLFTWWKTCYNICQYLWCHRGVSSVVRRCVYRHTGQELAVKIIEITAEKMTVQQLEEVKTSTLKEIQVLNMVKGHSSISELGIFSFQNANTVIFSFWRLKSIEPVLCFVPCSYSHWFIWVNDLHIFGVWPVSMTIARKSPYKSSLKWMWVVINLLCWFAAWGEGSCLTTSQKKLLWVKRKPGEP